MNNIIAIFFILSFCFNFAWANEDVVNIDLTNNHEFQQIIDDIYSDVIQKLPVKQRCLIFNSNQALSLAIGISDKTAEDLMKKCPPVAINEVARYFKKKYYFQLTKQSQLDSWTNLQNETTFYVDDHFTFQSLYLALLHELAMTYDAKSFLYYSHYLQLQNQSISSRSRFQFNSHQMTSKNSIENQRLRDRFNKALWNPFRYTFAALRAYQFEQIHLANTVPLFTHQECVEQFQNLFPQMLNFKDSVHANRSSITQYLELFTQITDESIGPGNTEELNTYLQDILSAETNLQENGKKVSFCQYMTTPLLSSQSYSLSLAHGPRPRLTNPNNGHGGGVQQFSRIQQSTLNSNHRLNQSQQQYQQLITKIRNKD